MRELSVSTVIDSAPEHVWDVMTGRLAEWWCPRPWHTEIIELDWRAGGRCAMIMRGPDGEAMPNDGVFLEVTPGKRWVSTDAFTTGWIPASPFMIGFWEITAEGDGTLYRAGARHWTDEALAQHEQMGFTEGWTAVADQLKHLCETGSLPDLA